MKSPLSLTLQSLLGAFLESVGELQYTDYLHATKQSRVVSWAVKDKSLKVVQERKGSSEPRQGWKVEMMHISRLSPSRNKIQVVIITCTYHGVRSIWIWIFVVGIYIEVGRPTALLSSQASSRDKGKCCLFIGYSYTSCSLTRKENGRWFQQNGNYISLH